MSVRNLVKQVLIEQQNKKYEWHLTARRMTYGQWLEEQGRKNPDKTKPDKPALGMQLQEDTRSALQQNISYVYFTMPGGRLAEGAEERIARYFRQHPKVQLLYADEDVWEKEPRKPWFKPDWSPDLLDSCFYFGSMVALRKEMWERFVAEEAADNCEYAAEKAADNCEYATEKAADNCEYAEEKAVNYEGIVQKSTTAVTCDAARQNRDISGYTVLNRECFYHWVRRWVSQVGGYQRGCKTIGHIPEVLFHCDSVQVQEQYRKGVLWKQTYGGCVSDNQQVFSHKKLSSAWTESCRLVSIIIPSKDNPEILRTCLEAIPQAAGGLPYEILLVDNGSSPKNKQRIEKLVQELYAPEHPIRYFYEPMEFHFSRMCNLGAEEAAGDLLLFLNDDVELAEKDSLLQMAELAKREYTGAVGSKLYYPASIKIQHAGVTNLPMGPVHKLQFLEDDVSYYFDSNRGCRNVLAVTAACLMVEKDKFVQAGGFPEELRVAFNDVGLCFRLYELGYQNVCRNDCYAYHHESLSRGDDESTEKLKRLLGERDVLYKRHPDLAGIDPYYGAGLGRDGLDTRIRPAYETAGNQVQQTDKAFSTKDLTRFRQDNCLLLRVEDSSGGRIQGYGVVLGDNNACYEKMMLLQAVSSHSAETFQSTKASHSAEVVRNTNASQFAETVQNPKAFAIIIEGQYRPDLVENMQDQCNVGLSGFWIKVTKENLPPGEYRIGMAVRNRVTNTRLFNWTNRTIAIPE